jgi:glycolate oxidase FAD binding subunit
VRDFILGVNFLDGIGELVRSGGKVVKNAAGFDLPKFMVGSLGCYGVLVKLAFKVLPRPESTATLSARYSSLVNGLEALVRLTRQPLELFALDLDRDARLLVRVGGGAETIPSRLERLKLAWNHGAIRQGQLGTLFMEQYDKGCTRKVKLGLLAYVFGGLDDYGHGKLLDLWERGEGLSPVDEPTRRKVGVGVGRG